MHFLKVRYNLQNSTVEWFVIFNSQHDVKFKLFNNIPVRKRTREEQHTKEEINLLR